MALPSEVGGRNTGGSLPDREGLHARVAAGAGSRGGGVLPLRTMDYGGQAFTVRDPDGHMWSVGEYDPWIVPA